MGWVSEGTTTTPTNNLRWTYSSSNGMTRRNQSPTASSSLWYVSSSKTFSPNKNYIFQTTVDSFDNADSDSSPTYSKFLEIETPWGDTFEYEENISNIWRDTRPTTDGITTIFYISSPTSEISSTDIVEYRSTYNGFGNPASDNRGTPYIKGFKLIETDWFFQGYALDDNTSDGWSYDEIQDKFFFRQRIFGYPQLITLSTSGSGYPGDAVGVDYIISGSAGTASVSGGSGWGLKLNFTVDNLGSISSVTIPSGQSNRGHSYLVNDVVTIPGGTVNATVTIDNIFGDNGTTGRSNELRNTVGGHTASNYIAKYIDYPVFNITFKAKGGDDSESYLSFYLVDNLPSSSTDPVAFQNDLSSGQFLGSITNDSISEYTFYNLTGQKYFLVTANYQLNDTSELLEFFDVRIDGSYQETDNNEQFLFTNSGTYSEPTELCLIGGSSDATYSVIIVNENTLHEQTGTPSNTFAGPTGSPGFFSNLYGSVINLNQLNAKVGNGTFKAGVWENGVWNSGWRVDNNVYEFDDVELSLLMATTNTRWRIQLTGPQTSTQNFSVGDRVSIGNIVGIDINENRKLMKNYFTVLSVTNNNIVVDFNNTFPLRRIEKDSENHKIKVSKNIWLNGGFLNGYFEGIWNGGLFKGFPYITEMYNTHWIDGRYDGGHFYGEYPEYTYIDTYYWGPTSPNTLGLTFGATAHGFEIGDLIEIDKDDKTINPQYDGFATVIDVIDEYMIIIDKGFGAASTDEGGRIKRRTGTAVIQNFEFHDNNTALLTTKDTTNLKQVYNYNSWVDVRYLNESASNLGRNLISYNSDVGEFSENNLYGYITRDVLSSISYFRNSFSLANSIYSLGTKYKIYEDFIGDASEFNEPFSSSGQPGLDNFIENGWTYSGTFDSLERTNDETMQIIGDDKFILENTSISIEKRRYSVVEFDLTNYVTTHENVITTGKTNRDYRKEGSNSKVRPRLYINSKTNVNIPGTNNPAFPNSNKVIHTATDNIKKYEYFFNKTGLDIGLDASASYTTITIGPPLYITFNFPDITWTGITASFDNIKMYELDMIPFFQYMTEEYINKAVQVPYQGIAPFIDYSDSEFSFIDNIDIGLDSLSTQQSYNPPSGGGGGLVLDTDIIFYLATTVEG